MDSKRTIEFQGHLYKLNQAEDLCQWCSNSNSGEYTVYYDTYVFHTEKNGFVAAYKNDLSNYWNI